MQKISQRVLAQECIKSMEKAAASSVTKELFKKLLGAGRVNNGKTKGSVSASEAIEELFNSGNSKAVDSFTNSTVKSLKKILGGKEALKAKKQSLDSSDLATETGKVLLEGNPNLGGASGTGAVVGAGIGALQDIDDENTNMLGVSQKKKGKFSDRLKNMAMGAAIGAAGGAGLKAKGIAKKNIEQQAKNVAREKAESSFKNLSDEEVLQKAFSSLTAGEYNDDLVKQLDKAYNSYLKGTGKQNFRDLKDVMRTYMFDNAPLNLGGLDPNRSGVLESFFDLIRGRRAQRKALANDYTSAVYELLRADKNRGAEQAKSFARYMSSGFNSNVDAWKSLYHNPGKSGMDEETLGRISKIIAKLNNESNPDAVTKAFQTRKPILWSPFRWDTLTTPLYRGDTHHGEPYVVGYSNDLINKLRAYIATKNSVDDII